MFVFFFNIYLHFWGFLGGSLVKKKKKTPASTGDVGSIPKSFPWRRKWQPIPVFLSEKSHDRGAWQATVHGVAKESDIT